MNSGADNCGELSVPLSLTICLPYQLSVTNKQESKMIQTKQNKNGFTAFVEDDSFVIKEWGITKEKAKQTLIETVKFLSEKEVAVLLNCYANSSDSDGNHILYIPEGVFELIHEALNDGEKKIRSLTYLIE